MPWGFLLLVSSSCSWWWLTVVWLLVELQWKEPDAGGGATSTTLSIKLVSRGRSEVSIQFSELLLLARHGGENRKGFQDFGCWKLDLRQGRSCASLGRVITAVFSPSFFRAEWRLLPPRALATVYSGQRLKDINLQAFMPHRRPSGDDVVGSHLSAPSGNVPGGVEVGSVELSSGGHGAGPDCFLDSVLKVLCANSMGLILVSNFSKALCVKCKATALMNG